MSKLDKYTRDAWTFDDGKLLLGDCLAHMKAMKSKSVDLVVGSPPYEGQRLYLEDGENLGIARKTQDWVDWMIEVYRAALRVCKGLVAFVVGHGRKKNYRWSGAPALLCADLIRAGICLRDPKIYARYGIQGGGGPDDMRQDFEWIVCATAEQGRLHWSNNKALGTKPKYKRGGLNSNRRTDGTRYRTYTRTTTSGYVNGDTATTRVTRKDLDIANPGSIIWCGAVGGGHLGSNIAHDNEAPYPEKIPDFFIRSYCPPKGIVYDPFGGSGTTVAVAIKTGRQWLASDLRESQIKLMLRRIKQARRRKGFGL